MKFLILVPDGAADHPVPALGGRTPLEAAAIPNLDRLAREGLVGVADTIPPGLSPGSDVANLALMGYDPARFYTGRGPLEAASLGVTLEPGDIAFRCNLISVESGARELLADYSAGHITTEEAAELIDSLKRDLEPRFASARAVFYPGKSYRHLMVLRGDFSAVVAQPPHDHVGRPVAENLPSGPGSDIIRDIMEASRSVLAAHPVNRARREAGLPTADMIWLWGQGGATPMPDFTERYGLAGAVISAVDLIKGIAVLARMDVVEVPGATGYFDTDYEAKAEYALAALDDHDLVFVHVEAPDEAGHIGDTEAKIKALEDFDGRLAGQILAGLPRLSRGESDGVHVLVVPDHATPLDVRTHVVEPVPFAIWPRPANPVLADVPGVDVFSESAARSTGLHVREGYRLMDALVKDEWPAA